MSFFELVKSLLLSNPSEQDRRITNLEDRMASFNEQLTDLDNVTNEIADRFEAHVAIVTELRAAIAAGDERRVQELAAQEATFAEALAAGVARLRDLGTDQENPVPDTEPLPEPTPVDEVPVDGTEPTA